MELYLHIPFCVKKCRYCDFLSGPERRCGELADYLAVLKREISEKSILFRDVPVTSIFFGGGTPSLMTGEQAAELMECLKQNFSVDSGAEITMECNPGTVNAQKLSAYRACGINRISFGLQSVHDSELKLLGRIHTFEDFKESWQAAREAGIDNLSLDLMSGLPGQTLESWQETLQTAVSFSPEHISAYSLIIEEGTPFYDSYEADLEIREAGGSPELLPSEEEERAMYALTKLFLEEKGYSRYEISNYARPGRESRHNTGYWTGVPYLGLGTGAASYYADENRQWMRLSNTRDLDAYLAGNFSPAESEEVSVRAAMEEFMFLGLRMTQGVRPADFRVRFGREIDEVYGEVIETLCGEGLLEKEGGYIRLTEHGVDVSNYALAAFLLDEEP